MARNGAAAHHGTVPRAVFFDLDDTLLNTSGGVEEAWLIAISEVAGPAGAEYQPLRDAIRREATEFWKDEAAAGHWRTKLNDARTLVVERSLALVGLDAALGRPLADRYLEAIMARYTLFDDALATLDLARSRGLQLGLLTNGPADLQRYKVERFDLARLFDVIVIEGEFGRGKPDRAVFDHALATTGTSAEDAWMVGDNLYADIGGARKAGIHAVWIHRDRLEMKDSAEHHPDRVIAHLPEIHNHLDG